MKKLLIAVFALTIVLPIKAADFDIYGRMSPGLWFNKTEGFYEDSIGLTIDTFFTTPIGDTTYDTTTIMGADSLPSYYCTLWPYGTLGFRVKSDRISACIEVGIRQGMYEGYINSDSKYILLVKEHMSVYAKKFYLEWYINDLITLLIGKNDAPASFFSSNQRLYGDYRFRNAGCLYTGSKAMIQLSMGNGLSSSDPAEGFLWEAKVAALKVDTAAVMFRDADVKIYTEAKMPKFEGSFALHLAKGFMSTDLEVGGGYQQYNMAIHNQNVPVDVSKEKVDCYITGFECGAKIGPVKLSYDWAWGQNVGAYGLEMGNPFIWRAQKDPLSDIINIFYPYHENVTTPSDTIIDIFEMKNGKAVEMCWILNIKPLEWLALEGGYGYVHAEHEFSGFDKSWNDTRAFYANLQIKIADILEVSPEFGQYLYGKKRGYGRFTYWGAEFAVGF